MADDEIQINLTLGLLKLKRDLDKAKAMLKNNFSTFTAGEIIDTQRQMKAMGNYSKSFTNVNEDLRQLGASATITGKQMMMGGANRAIGKIDTQLNALRGTFHMWALGVMFFGMAIMNVFRQIWTFGQKTFQDVMHSVEGTVTQFDFLEGSVKYLGFTLGQAFEPIAALLFPIIDKISEWVEENDKLAASITGAGVAFGLFLFTVGTLVLGIGSLKTAFANVVAAYEALTLKFASGGLSGLLTTLGVLAIGIAAFILLWKTNWAGFRSFIETNFESIWITLKGIWSDITEVFKGAFKIISGLLEGDMNKVWEGFIQIIKTSLRIAIRLFLFFSATLENAFRFMWNAISMLFINNLTNILKVIRTAIKAAEALTGKSLGSVTLTNAINNFKDLKDIVQVDFVTPDDLIDRLKAKANGEDSSSTNNNQQITVNIDKSTDQSVIDKIYDWLKVTE